MAGFITPKQNELIDILEQRICNLFDVTPALLASPLRDSRICQARFLLWTILREKLFLPSTGIGIRYNRDHSSVLSGLKTFRKSKNYKELKGYAEEWLKEERVVELRNELSTYSHL